MINEGLGKRERELSGGGGGGEGKIAFKEVAKFGERAQYLGKFSNKIGGSKRARGEKVSISNKFKTYLQHRFCIK
jgi:hypothetical protein